MYHRHKYVYVTVDSVERRQLYVGKKIEFDRDEETCELSLTAMDEPRAEAMFYLGCGPRPIRP